MARFTCPRCKERVLVTEERQHTVDQCKAAAKTFAYLRSGLRPFPEGHSLPAWMYAPFIDQTRSAYDGEPREERPLLTIPETQLWFPRWVDIIVALWSGPIYLEGATRQAQRDDVLRRVASSSTHFQRRLIDAHAEDLRAVRAYVAPMVTGPLPQLLSEVEGRG
jgi:hypothetical protein